MSINRFFWCDLRNFTRQSQLVYLSKKSMEQRAHISWTFLAEFYHQSKLGTLNFHHSPKVNGYPGPNTESFLLARLFGVLSGRWLYQPWPWPKVVAKPSLKLANDWGMKSTCLENMLLRWSSLRSSIKEKGEWNLNITLEWKGWLLSYILQTSSWGLALGVYIIEDTPAAASLKKLEKIG